MPGEELKSEETTGKGGEGASFGQSKGGITLGDRPGDGEDGEVGRREERREVSTEKGRWRTRRGDGAEPYPRTHRECLRERSGSRRMHLIFLPLSSSCLSPFSSPSQSPPASLRQDQPCKLDVQMLVNHPIMSS